MNILQILDMGGYGAYIWPSYGLAVAILVYHMVKPWYTEKQLRYLFKELNDKENNL